jgi:ketopantoate reductase
MRVLVVGMGALGQVFGAHLARGGAQVSCLVRPSQAQATRGGYRLSALRRWRRPEALELAPTQVFTEVGQVDGDWDAVWLCTHSTGLREPWVETLRARTGEATTVSIGAGVDDRAALERWWPASQIVEVFPSVLAFSPTGADRDVDTAFWVPPGVRPVSGDAARGRPVAEALNRGGLPARYVGAVARAQLSSAFNMPMIAAEEAAGWSPSAFRRSMPLALAAAAEAMAATAARLGVPAPPAPSPFDAWKNATLFALAAPFDAAGFRRRHFTKVGEQTLQMLDGWIAEGRSRNLAVGKLTALRDALVAQRETGR